MAGAWEAARKLAKVRGSPPIVAILAVTGVMYSNRRNTDPATSVQVGRARVVIAVVALVVLGAAHGCTREDQPADNGRPNVLLIAVDTLRVDKLGCYGSELGATPNIDALAAEGVRFEKAYAHAPWTLPAFASLMTSLNPPQHGAGGWLGQFHALAPAHRTLAECFRDHDYTTAEIVNVEFLSEQFGMTQGFEHVDYEAHPDNVQVRSATDTTDAALEWLQRRRSRPFFLFVHYFDPHLVYAPPLEFRKRFAHRLDRDNSNWVFGTRQQIIAIRRGQMSIGRATIERAEKLYDGEVAYTDQQVGRLLDGLTELQLNELTIVVFTADHGEEFMDHGGFEHGHTLYDELVRVPLIIRFPARLQPDEISTTVRHIDVGPTLCELAGVQPEPAFAGRNLLDVLSGTDSAPAPTPVLIDGNFWGPPHRGWLNGGFKLIVSKKSTQLFELRRDPGEQTDLSATRPSLVQQMLSDMDLARAAGGIEVGEAPPVHLSPKERERLRALGYLE